MSDAKDHDSDDDGGALLAGTRNYISPAGLTRLRGELKRLLTVDRPKVVEIVAWAAGNGDRSENGDYIYGKRRLREIDRRMRFLQKRIEVAEVVDPDSLSGDTVRFGATVTVADGEGDERTYTIVGIDETDASRGLISWISPLGRALLRKSEGDIVNVHTPRGDEELEIVQVRFEAWTV